MITDIRTVFCKEWNEYLHSRSSKRGTLFMILFPVIIFGVFFPLQEGREWVESPVPVISFAWIPLLFVSALIADSFAGERERHTLETLLASRLPDKAILMGKFCSAVSYGLGLTGLIVLSGLISVNIAYGKGELLLYPLKATLAGAVVCILMSCFVAGAGILISLKASTVRQAHQTLSFSIIAVVLLPAVAFRFIPDELRKNLIGMLNTVDPVLLIVFFLGGLVLLDAVLLLIAISRFKRAKMILD